MNVINKQKRRMYYEGRGGLGHERKVADLSSYGYCYCMWIGGCDWLLVVKRERR